MDRLFLYWMYLFINLNKIITPKTTRSTTQKSSQFCQNLQTNWIMSGAALLHSRDTGYG